MIQKQNREKPQNDRRMLTFPAVHPCEGISPPTLLDSLLVLARRIGGFNPKSFATQRRNSREAIRQIGILSIFFEEIRDRGLRLPFSVVLSFSELHLAFQKILFLLEDCSREGTKVWILMKCRIISTQFRVLIRAIATALDVLPIDSVDVCGEIKELIELVGKQARKSNLSTDPKDEQAMNHVISILNVFEKGIEPAADFLNPVLDYLGIRTWAECDAEVRFLEKEIEFGYSDCQEKEVPFLSSLLGFMCYSRGVLFKTGEVQNGRDLSDAKINTESLHFVNPQDFRCPISLDLMTDPVIISTGQTYDRNSIQTWLKAGNVLCPITGEILTNTELVPNTALKKLIVQFCTDNGVSLSKSRKKSLEIAHTLVPGSPAAEFSIRYLSRFLARSLVFGSDQDRNKAAYEIRLLAKSNVFNRSFLVDSGTVPPLLQLLSSPDRSMQENAMAALLKLAKHTNGKKAIVEAGGVNPIVEVLNSGLSSESRQTAAATIFYLSSVKGYRKLIGESPAAIQSLIGLIKNGTNCGKKNAVVAIFALVLYPKNKERFLEAGLVSILLNLIASTDKSELVTDSLAVLAELSDNTEGAFSILQESPLPLLTKTVRSPSVTKSAKEYSVSILLSLCRTGGREIAAELAVDASLMGSLYSLVTEGTSRYGKRACSLIGILQDSLESKSYHRLMN